MARGKSLLRIDFDEDGDFTEANSDVTSKARTRLKLVQGKVLAKHKVEASQLSVTLKNDDHAYSPSNSDSPFFPMVKLSPVIWWMFGYPVDTFDVANTTTLSSRKPDYDDTFDAWGGDAGSFQADTNKLKASSAANLTAALNFGEANCFVGVKFTRNGSNSGLVLRWSSTSNFFLIRSDGSNLYLSKVESGTMTTVASASHTWASGAEKWILAECHGNDFRVAVDDTLVLSELTGATSAFNNTATRHGVGGRACHANDRWDDFGGWRSMFYGRIDATQPRPHVSRQYTYITALDDMERLSKHSVYRLTPDVPVYAEDVISEVLDGADFSSTNRIISLPDPYGSEVGTVSATGSSTFRLDDAGRGAARLKFTDGDWTDGTYLVRITDASGTTALGWIGPEDIDGDGTRVALFTDSKLDTLGYVESDSGFDESDTPLTYNVIWQPLTEQTLARSALGRNALTELYQVADDDVGQFFIDGSGFARFEGYRHRIPGSGHHATSINTWYASQPTPAESDIYFEDLIWDDGKDRVENEVYFRFHHLNFASAARVYRLHPNDIPSINPGQTLSILAIGEGDVIGKPRVPVHTTDFALNSQAGGGGTDLLARVTNGLQQGTVSATGASTYQLDDAGQDFGRNGNQWLDGHHQVRITDASGTTALGFLGTALIDADGTRVALYTGARNDSGTLTTLGYTDTDDGFDEGDGTLTYNIYNVTSELVAGFDGNFRQVRITNNSGSRGYLHFLQVYAQKGSKANESMARAENPESQSFIGRRRVEHTTLHLDKFSSAQRRAQARIGERSIPRERVIVNLTNATRANLMQIVHRQMSDQIHLSYSDMGVAGDYWVERKIIELSEGDTLIEATIELSCVDTFLAGSTTNAARAGLCRCR